MLLEFLIRKLKFWQAYRQGQESGREETPRQGPALSGNLERDLEHIHHVLGGSNDLKVHRFRFGPDKGLHGALVFIDGLVETRIITETVLKPVLAWEGAGEDESSKPPQVLKRLRESVLCCGDMEEKANLADVVAACLDGDTILLLDGTDRGIQISSKGWEKRGITEPQTEEVVRGPREGFTENLRTNTALLRRKIKSPQLRLEHLIVGRKTLTKICILYLQGVSSERVINKVKERIAGLQVDSILEAGYIEQYIEDAPFSIFSTVGYSEKPDVVAAKVLEGRVAIVVDGTPFVLTVPMLFIESFQTSEDYYVRSVYATLTRIMRFFAYVIAVYGPAIYIALTTFHQEFIPTTLLFTIAQAREGTPFPAFLEALVMVFSFEVLREAGVRLPRPVGQTISIVGALIMGDAAVSAGLVGAPLVIAVALTSVAGFVVPTQNDSISILRTLNMFLAAVLGGYGIAMGFLATLIHLASLKSFGIPYFEGLTISRDLQDEVVRMPLWFMTRRPKNLARQDITRRRFFIPPLRPHEDEQEGKEEEKP